MAMLEEAVDAEEAEARADKAEKALKEAKRKLTLLEARPAADIEVRTPASVSATAISLSNIHLGVLVSVLAVLAGLWQLVGVPMTGLRDDVRDIKNNYVRKDDLRDLARKDDVNALKTLVDTHSVSITRFEQLKEQRDGQIKSLQDGQSKHDNSINAFEQRLTRIEAKEVH